MIEPVTDKENRMTATMSPPVEVDDFNARVAAMPAEDQETMRVAVACVRKASRPDKDTNGWLRDLEAALERGSTAALDCFADWWRWQKRRWRSEGQPVPIP